MREERREKEEKIKTITEFLDDFLANFWNLNTYFKYTISFSLQYFLKFLFYTFLSAWFETIVKIPANISVSEIFSRQFVLIHKTISLTYCVITQYKLLIRYLVFKTIFFCTNKSHFSNKLQKSYTNELILVFILFQSKCLTMKIISTFIIVCLTHEITFKKLVFIYRSYVRLV